MQQKTFIASMEVIEDKLVERIAFMRIYNPEEDSKSEEAFNAVHKILKSFFKVDGMGYGDVVLNEKIIDVHSRYASTRENDAEGWVKEALSVNADIIEMELSNFSGRKYIMSDQGNKFSLTSKSVKDNFAKIKACIA
jgi:hypothetical protein